MILKRCYLLLLIFPVITDTINADGTGIYIGGDISSVKLNIGHPSINHQNATGYHLLIGGKSENWEVEAAATGGTTFNTDPSPGMYYPENTAEYGKFDLGLKRYFHPENQVNVSPWIAAGLGLQFIDWRSYYYQVDSYGYSMSAGLDFQINKGWFFRGCAVYHDFTSNDTYDDGTHNSSSSQLRLAINYLF